MPTTTQNLPIKQPPEDARRAKELLLFGDIPEEKLDRLHALLHLTTDPTELEALDWAEPLELPESRVLAWFRYQRKSGASQSPAPSKPEEVDELSTPSTLVKHELSPEATESELRSSSGGADTPESDDERPVEMQVSRQDIAQSSSMERQGQLSPSLVQEASLPSMHQLPTPRPSASTSPNPSEGDQSFAQQQGPIFSPSSMQATHSRVEFRPLGRTTASELEDGEIVMENMERQLGTSSLPTVGSAEATLGARTGNTLFPGLTPRASPPMVPPMRQSPSRGGALERNSWDADRPLHSTQSSWGDSSRQQEHPSSRQGPPSPYRDYGKGKARERLDVHDQREESMLAEQRGPGPHRDRPRPSRIQTHPYPMNSSSFSHRSHLLLSTSISDATAPATSRSTATSSTSGVSVSPPLRGPDACRIIQAVSMALKDLPIPSVQMDVDSHAEEATPTTEQIVRKILEINSWALGAAKSLGVSLQDHPPRGAMPPPPNPSLSSNFRK